jgi:hypothetical protein
MNWLRSLWPGRATPSNDTPVIAADGGCIVVEPEVPTITASDLWTAWYANAVDAENRWGGRPLRISGRVVRVERRERDRLAVVLRVDDWRSVVCRFPEGRRAELAGVRPGDEVAVIGTMRVMLTFEAWLDADRRL